ncbi:uncharacterized protein BKA55DRAFT_589900 [Fusarium redolens]|uniref:Uncharacterized protein n=1 Tax=Fusarium redolens TaxID=48865 RepID=A0A9P9R6U0_FUSRE|nr:uncharacterized protein BKA55DRAFT_589900 [Fusarium redolens]KAH7267518.1 hypothetical protein BKA55DRAFT_589900 [Fusarium redolens]
MSALSKLPKSSQDWTRIAQQHSVVDSSIHDLADLNSGSQDWISRDVLKKATSFLESFGQDEKKISEGSFSMVQYYQRLSIQPRQKPSHEEIDLSSPKVAFSPRVTRSQAARRYQGSTSRPETPSRPPKEDMSIDEHFGNLVLDPDTSSLNSDPLGPLSYHSSLSGETGKQYQSIEDEQIVNTALILFLNALTLHCDSVQGAWTLYRKPFVVKASATKVYEARVDGLLRVKDRTCAIVEVKPFIRYGSEKNAGQDSHARNGSDGGLGSAGSPRAEKAQHQI